MTYRYNPLAKPFLKWAGGKRQLLSEIIKHVPADFDTYYEPFVGGGAVLFQLQPPKAKIADINQELINCYLVVRDYVDELLEDLGRHINDEDYYYHLRNLDRNEEEFNKLSPVKKASRLIFLNKTCYNGLFRVNSQGHFNVPFGRYRVPKFRDEKRLKAVSNYLKTNDICIRRADFAEAVADAREGDFVYFDPPYDPISPSSSFTGYAHRGFSREEQERLKKVYDSLTARGVKCLLSNSATDFIMNLYRDYEMIEVEANRVINSDSSKRGKVPEILVRNW